MQIAKLNEIIAAVTTLNKTNEGFKQTFDKQVSQRQADMTKQVVDKLNSMPGTIAGNEQLVNALSSLVSAKLTTNEEFLKKIRSAP